MITDDERYARFTNRDQLLGMEFMCALFSTSPRMHKPQMEIIKAQHAAINRRLDALDETVARDSDEGLRPAKAVLARSAATQQPEQNGGDK
jgi:hypothetical protein